MIFFNNLVFNLYLIVLQQIRVLLKLKPYSNRDPVNLSTLFYLIARGLIPPKAHSPEIIITLKMSELCTLKILGRSVTII